MRFHCLLHVRAGEGVSRRASLPAPVEGARSAAGEVEAITPAIGSPFPLCRQLVEVPVVRFPCLLQIHAGKGGCLL